MRRWAEQRWPVDDVIRANGVDWDQLRSIYINAACCCEPTADFAGIRQRVQKYADALADWMMDRFTAKPLLSARC